MYPGGSFYGINKILLKYAKLPQFLPLPFAIQHGWQRIAHEYESSTNPPEIWVWSARIAEDLAKYYPRKRIRVVGSFFCYLIKSHESKNAFVLKEGSICIPPHSSHLAKSLYSVEDFAKSLSKLPKNYHPIRIMVYYLDMTKDVVEVYRAHGFEVVSNGDLYNPIFLNNFVKNIADKKYCIFSDLGSGVLYSTYLGLTPHHIDINSHIVNMGNIHLTSSYINTSKKFDEDFLNKINTTTVKDELGENYIISPQEMRCMIIRNYFTFRFALTFSRLLTSTLLRRLRLIRL